MPAANGLHREAGTAAAPQTGAAFVRWLQGSGLPESLWDRLLTKVADGEVGAGDALLVRLRSAANMVAAECIAVWPVTILLHGASARQPRRQAKAGGPAPQSIQQDSISARNIES